MAQYLSPSSLAAQKYPFSPRLRRGLMRWPSGMAGLDAAIAQLVERGMEKTTSIFNTQRRRSGASPEVSGRTRIRLLARQRAD